MALTARLTGISAPPVDGAAFHVRGDLAAIRSRTLDETRPDGSYRADAPLELDR